MKIPFPTKEEIEEMDVAGLRTLVAELQRDKAETMQKLKNILPLINYCLQLIDDIEHGRTPTDGG